MTRAVTNNGQVGEGIRTASVDFATYTVTNSTLSVFACLNGAFLRHIRSTAPGLDPLPLPAPLFGLSGGPR